MDVEVCHVRERDEPDKPKRQRRPQKGLGRRSKAVDIEDTDFDPEESSHDDCQHPGVDYGRIEIGNSDNPIVIHDNEVDDYPIPPQNRKRSRMESESLVSGGSAAKRKGHAFSKNPII